MIAATANSYGLRTEDIDSVSWESAVELIDGLSAEPNRVLGEGESCNLMTSTVACWSEEASYAAVAPIDEGTRALVERLPEPCVVDGQLTADQLAAVKEILRADLERVKGALMRDDSAAIEDGYKCLGQLDVDGAARSLRMEADPQVGQYPVDGLYLSIERLTSVGVLAQIPGLKQS